MEPNKRIAIGFSVSAYSLLQRLEARGHVDLIGLSPGAASQLNISAEKLLIDKPKKIFQTFWGSGSTFIVVGAIGAVVRIIAPLIADKDNDPAILVLDSRAQNIIPLLGAHKAGAEAFACSLAQDLGGNFVPTGFSRTKEILPIDSFGEAWGWKRTGDKTDWNDFMIYLSQQNQIFVEQTAGSTIWNSSKGAVNTFFSSDNRINHGNCPVLNIGSAQVQTCSWHPPILWLGIGCEKNTSPALVERAFLEAFQSSCLAKEALAGMATIDIKSNETALKILQEKESLPLRLYSSQELLGIAVPNPSEAVQAEVGTPSVAEAASLLASGNKGVLKFEKHIYRAQENEKGAVTIAIAESQNSFAPQRGQLNLVGSGPGDISFLTNDARFALSRSVVWIGYNRYLDLLEPLRRFDQVRIDSPIKNETKRCRQALQLATEGMHVALISSGDSGIYGMAGLALDLWLAKSKSERPEFKVHPGISSLQMAAAKIGAPLMHDFCAISLSDCLTSWDEIEKRIQAASCSDFVIAFYNPRSRDRDWQLQKAFEILLENRPQNTPVVLARQLGRTEEQVEVHMLDSVTIDKVDMLTILLIGNSKSCFQDGYVFTPRGY